MNLADWLLEQITEDEQIARDALDPEYDWWWGTPESPAEAHLARWNPKRVLAECDAKRLVVAEHTDSDYPDDPPCPPCLDEMENDEGHAILHMKPQPCPTVRALAAPYADCPGYREEWRPAASPQTA